MAKLGTTLRKMFDEVTLKGGQATSKSVEAEGLMIEVLNKHNAEDVKTVTLYQNGEMVYSISYNVNDATEYVETVFVAGELANIMKRIVGRVLRSELSRQSLTDGLLPRYFEYGKATVHAKTKDQASKIARLLNAGSDEEMKKYFPVGYLKFYA